MHKTYTYGAGAGPYGGTYATGGKTIATVKSYGVDARPTRVSLEETTNDQQDDRATATAKPSAVKATPTQVSPKVVTNGQQGGKCVKLMTELGLLNDESDAENDNIEAEAQVESSPTYCGSVEDVVSQYLKNNPSYLLKLIGEAIANRSTTTSENIQHSSVRVSNKRVGLVPSREFSVGAELEACNNDSDTDDGDDDSEYADDSGDERSTSFAGKRLPSAIGKKSRQKAAHNSFVQRQWSAAIDKNKANSQSLQKKMVKSAGKKASSSAMPKYKPAPGLNKHIGNVRPADNADLTPLIAPNMKLTTSIDHSQTNPTQSVRQHVPYPAPDWLRDASEEMYWKNLEAADQKVVAHRASTSSSTEDGNFKNGREASVTIPWTIFEDDLVIGHMLDIRVDPSVPETEARFAEVSKRLQNGNNIWRTKTSIKNMWNRVGRARSGFDERRRQGGPAATSMQGNMVKKMINEAKAAKQTKKMAKTGSAGNKRKRYEEDSDKEAEEPVHNTRVCDMDAASRAWMFGVRDRKARKVC